MAMICKNGGRSCTGCMNCLDDEELYTCPCCGTRIAYDAKVYIHKSSDEVIGCERCIRAEDAEDVRGRLQ